MAGENIRIQPPIVPNAPQTNEKYSKKSRGRSTFELREKPIPVSPRKNFEEKSTDDSRPGLPDEQWLRERTFAELKTIVKAVQIGETDPWELTDLIFYARHPEMKGVPMTADNQDLLDEWNSISALLVHPTLNEIKNLEGTQDLSVFLNEAGSIRQSVANSSDFQINAGTLGSFTTRYDNTIANAVEWCPGLSPSVLKSLLAQESKFHPTVINSYGYAGIAQFGRTAAREVGLNVGIAGSASDERLHPDKAIPGAARLLNIKAKRLGEMAFSRYGQPEGVEFWKFVTAAYNGGEGTVTVAMGHAYRNGLEQARSKGLVGTDAVSFARRYASQWDNLKIGGMGSPLGLAAARYFPNIANQKFHEIGNYPTQIMARVSGDFR